MGKCLNDSTSSCACRRCSLEGVVTLARCEAPLLASIPLVLGKKSVIFFMSLQSLCTRFYPLSVFHVGFFIF